MSELRRVADFRNRLVAYLNVVLPHAGRYSNAMEEADRLKIATERPILAQEYGRLYKVINRYGTMQMSSPALGITSRDVIQDAIHDMGDVYYADIARLALQHLDTLIGRLEADTARDPDAIYRMTSPLYWLRQLGRAIGWLWGTTRRRVLTVIGALLLAIISGVASGWAQALFTPR